MFILELDPFHYSIYLLLIRMCIKRAQVLEHCATHVGCAYNDTFPPGLGALDLDTGSYK